MDHIIVDGERGDAQEEEAIVRRQWSGVEKEVIVIAYDGGVESAILGPKRRSRRRDEVRQTDRDVPIYPPPCVYVAGVPAVLDEEPQEGGPAAPFRQEAAEEVESMVRCLVIVQ